MYNRKRKPYVEKNYFERSYFLLASLFIQCDAQDYHRWDPDFIRINNMLATGLFPEIEAERTHTEPKELALSAKYHGRQYYILGGDAATPEFYDEMMKYSGFASMEALMQHDFKPWQVKQSIALIEDFCNYQYCQGIEDMHRSLCKPSVPAPEKKKTSHILDTVLAIRAAEEPDKLFPNAEGFLSALSGRTPAAGYWILAKSPEVQDALVPLIGNAKSHAIDQLFHVREDVCLEKNEFTDHYKDYVAKHLAECWPRQLAKYDMDYRDIEIKDIGGVLTDTEHLLQDSSVVYVKNPMTGKCILTPQILEREAGYQFPLFYSTNDASRLLSDAQNAFFVSADSVNGDTVERNTMRLTGDDFSGYSISDLVSGLDIEKEIDLPPEPAREETTAAAQETADEERA